MTKPWVVPVGLAAAWLANDLEEWFTMAPWSAKNAHKLDRLPVTLPWPKEGIPARQAHLAIGSVGVCVAAAATLGVKTQGKSSFYRSVLLAFGIHGFAHLGQSLLMKGYTPGVVTAATVVIPFWARAEKCNRRSGLGNYTCAEKLGAAALLLSLPGIVGTAGAITKLRQLEK